MASAMFLRRMTSFHPTALALKAKSFRVSTLTTTTFGSGGGFSFPSPRSLQSIVKLEELMQETPSNVRRIWQEYHEDKADGVASVLNVEEFQRLVQRAKDCPFFVFPVYRVNKETKDVGFFTMLAQFQDTCFLLTTLDAYRENPSQAPPCMTISLFDDLVQSKELALLRGDVANVLEKQVSFIYIVV
jgi:ATP synthase F1 complex assembly factor 1